MNDPRCQVCQSGNLLSKKKHRMSAPVATVGYLFLAGAALSLLLCILMVLAIVFGSSEDKTNKEAQMREELARSGVSEEIIDKFISREITQSDKNKLTGAQRSALHNAEGKYLLNTAARGATIGLLGICSIITGILSFFGGVFGLLLTMKKRVLQCNSCGATVSAS